MPYRIQNTLCPYWPGVNVDDAVGIDIEGDLHLGDAAGGGRDSNQLELTWTKKEKRQSINQK